MARWRRRILIGLIIGWVMYVVVTGGGVVVWTYQDFAGQTQMDLAPGLRAQLWIKATSSKWGVPLIGTLLRSGAPYVIQLDAWDPEGVFDRLDIAEIVVEYSDGSVVRGAEELSLVFEPWSRASRKASATIPGVIGRHSAVRLLMVGSVTKSDRTTLVVRMDMTYEPRSGRKVDTMMGHVAGV